jgi:hypothetical protein
MSEHHPRLGRLDSPDLNLSALPSAFWSMRPWESAPCVTFGRRADSPDHMDQSPMITWEGKETVKTLQTGIEG